MVKNVFARFMLIYVARRTQRINRKMQKRPTQTGAYRPDGDREPKRHA